MYYKHSFKYTNVYIYMYTINIVLNILYIYTGTLNIVLNILYIYIYMYTVNIV